MKTSKGCLNCLHADVIRDRFSGVMNGYCYCLHPKAKEIKESVYSIYIYEIRLPVWCPGHEFKND